MEPALVSIEMETRNKKNERVNNCFTHCTLRNLTFLLFYLQVISGGSGFVVEEDGLILTNAHVVFNKPRASVQVWLQDGRTFTGIVEDVDVKSDLESIYTSVMFTVSEFD